MTASLTASAASGTAAAGFSGFFILSYASDCQRRQGRHDQQDNKGSHMTFSFLRSASGSRQNIQAPAFPALIFMFRVSLSL